MVIHINILYIFILLFVLEIIYFKLADHFNIIDEPNHRSSHTIITIRGGGIIFTLGMLLCPLFFGLQYPFFLAGLVLVALISFLDDIDHIPGKFRIIIHIASALLLLTQLNFFDYSPYIIIAGLFVVVGTINATNFMDGINGITGIYALIALCTLYYLNINLAFTNANYLGVAIASVIVFNFFNFRKTARCFAGDVGSVGIAFIISFFLFQLIIHTHNLGYLSFLVIYGLDTSTTIIFRIIRGEKITEAHRTHFFQYLVNEKRLPHLLVAVLYGLAQLLVNIVGIHLNINNFTLLMLFFAVSTALFLVLRFAIEGKKHLMTRQL